MRIVSVPEAVEAKFMGRDEDGKSKVVRQQPITFEEFVKTLAMGHAYFRTGEKGSIAYDRVMTVLENGPDVDASGGEGQEKSVYQFQDEDFTQLEMAAKEVQWNHTDINRALRPFYKALKEAQEVPTPMKNLRKV